MTPDDFLKDLVKTAEADQGLAGFVSMAKMFAAFYLGLLADDVPTTEAVVITCELMRCMVGDHKPPA